MKRAFITGISGQVGSFLAEWLLHNGYEVHGLVRREGVFANLKHIRHELHLHYGDLLDEGQLRRVLAQTEPDEVYNLAAQAHVQISFEQPVYTGDATGLGAVRLFESVRSLGLGTRVYQASSSEMFGATAAPQSLDSPFVPLSPYACAKHYAHQLAGLYRDSYGMYISRGVMFNAESPRRPHHYVTRKVVQGALEIAFGWRDRIELGNLEARRDWGYAGDYVRAIHETLQKPTPDDYLIATGESHSVAELVELVFARIGKRLPSTPVLRIETHVVANPKCLRPLDVPHLEGIATTDKLSWRPHVRFEQLIDLMIEADLQRMRSRGEDI